MADIYNIQSLRGLDGIAVVVHEIGGLSDDPEQLAAVSRQIVQIIGKQLTVGGVPVVTDIDETNLTPTQGMLIVDANFVAREDTPFLALTAQARLLQVVTIDRLGSSTHATTWSQASTGLVTITEFWTAINKTIHQMVDLLIQAYHKAQNIEG